MLNAELRRQAAARAAKRPRFDRELRAVACGMMGIPFGPVRVADGETAPGYTAEAYVSTQTSEGGCTRVSSVAVRWEMTDNRQAIVAAC